MGSPSLTAFDVRCSQITERNARTMFRQCDVASQQLKQHVLLVQRSPPFCPCGRLLGSCSEFPLPLMSFPPNFQLHDTISLAANRINSAPSLDQSYVLGGTRSRKRVRTTCKKKIFFGRDCGQKPCVCKHNTRYGK
jgi:hypothetical protein